LDELGVILPTDNKAGDNVPPPPAYWNVAGALYGYLYIQLSRMQIDIIGESQLIGYPTQYPSVSMMDWESNKPNARFWVLKLIKDSFHPGDTLVETGINTGDVTAQAYITPTGHKLLLVNKRNEAVDIPIGDIDKNGAANAKALTVDLQSGEEPARSVKLVDGKLRLEAFAVTVVSW
jgi:uncharacterized protein YggU (UPF0235/DUF167 family)